jgi:hypothetical protein
MSAKQAFSNCNTNFICQAISVCSSVAEEKQAKEGKGRHHIQPDIHILASPMF